MAVWTLAFFLLAANCLPFQHQLECSNNESQDFIFCYNIMFTPEVQYGWSAVLMPQDVKLRSLLIN